MKNHHPSVIPAHAGIPCHHKGKKVSGTFFPFGFLALLVPALLALSSLNAAAGARQVNPLSGGGIASGMIGGKIAGTLAAEAIKKNDLKHILKYDKIWHKERGKTHEIFNGLKEGIYGFSDEDFNNIMEKISAVAPEKRTMQKLFMIALANKPSLLVDVAKVFLV